MTDRTTKPELLAPAGNMEKLRTAFTFGADAVYLGAADFSLRVRVNDFNITRIKRAVNYAHKEGKKAYVTVNIFAHNSHLKKLPEHIKKLKQAGVDGLIASDPGVIEIIKEVWPEAEIHLSTQANCINWKAAEFWREQGVTRIILGRETTLEDIREIKKRVPKMELEYFVHGAMCMAYSGRCFLSQYFLGRSANLGDCVQPCRWGYGVQRVRMSEEGGSELVAEEDEKGSYLLNSRDLCLVEYLDQLQRAGVDSFKIEGRNKSVYYLATVCGVYRRAIDAIHDDSGPTRKELRFLRRELEEKLVNRGYTTGFLKGGPAEQNAQVSHHQSSWEFCGQVIKKPRTSENKYLLPVKVHNCIKKGDIVEIVSPFYNVDRIEVDRFWNADTGAEMTEAHGGGSKHIILLEVNKSVSKMSILRRKIT